MNKTMNRKLGMLAAILLGATIILGFLSNVRIIFEVKEYFGHYFRANAVIWLAQAAVIAALFRGKKDQLGGILFGAAALIFLIKLFSGFSFVNLLLVLMFGAFAVVCLMGDKLNLGKLEMLFAALGLVIGLVYLFTSARNYAFNMGARNVFHIIRSMFVHIRRFFQVGFALLRFVIAAVSYICMGLAFANIQTKKESSAQTYQPYQAAQGAPVYSAAPASTQPEGFFNLGIHVLLLLVTGGIWLLIWVYRTTAYLNRTPGEEQLNPTNKMLLFLFVPFYSIYWTYKQAQRLDKLAQSKGIPSDSANTCLILAIFLPIVAYILMQDKVNKTAEAVAPAAYTAPAATYAAPTAPAATYTAPAAPAASAPQNDQNAKYQELIQLKQLLDAGVITDEEFELKKKQILGL